MSDQFKTIKRQTREVVFKDRGSKFIGKAFPVSDTESVKAIISELKKEYHDARHWCYAYRIGIGTEESYRANDDGEPNNSAGMPIYNQLLSFDLTNVLAVVIRYFGGTKLGVSGLINAYKQTARMSLEEADIIEDYLLREVTIVFEYPAMDKVMKLIHEFEASILNQDMQTHCEMRLAVRKSKIEQFLHTLSGIQHLKILPD